MIIVYNEEERGAYVKGDIILPPLEIISLLGLGVSCCARFEMV